MALKIRLRRMGRKKAPHYRIVVAEATMPRDGRFVAIIGHYNPRTEPVTLVVKADEARKWLANGAKPTDTVHSLFRRAGVYKEPSAVEAAAAAVSGAASSAASTTAEAASGAASAVAGAASAAAATVADAASSVAGVVSDAVSGAVETVSDVAAEVVERVTGDDDATEAEPGVPAVAEENAAAPADDDLVQP